MYYILDLEWYIQLSWYGSGYMIRYKNRLMSFLNNHWVLAMLKPQTNLVAIFSKTHLLRRWKMYCSFQMLRTLRKRNKGLYDKFKSFHSKPVDTINSNLFTLNQFIRDSYPTNIFFFSILSLLAFCFSCLLIS